MQTISNAYCNRIGYLNDLWKFDGYNWTWMSGSSNETYLDGNYGIQGIPDANNVPSSKIFALGWTDLDGNLWLFGGGNYGNY
jgi:hypothetical protein